MKVIDWKNEIKEEELKEVSDALIDGKLVMLLIFSFISLKISA